MSDKEYRSILDRLNFESSPNSSLSGSTSTISALNYPGVTSTTSASGIGITDQTKQAASFEQKAEIDNYLTKAFSTLHAKADEIGRSAAYLKQSEKKITERLLESQNKIGEVDERLKKADEVLEQLGVSQKKIVDEVQLIRGNAVSALSIFVSFFAFITVSINVFSKAGSLTVGAVLVLLFWSMLVGFNVLIGWQFGTIKNNAMALVVLVFVAILSVFSLVLMYHWAPEAVALPKTILEVPK
ncbi:hypothetical protein ACF8MH_10580 [Pseudomonas sp. YQ_13]|uniref:hypothetical protein n=1 Tax=Pseudomonas TaxID=286 RepID=UPI0031334A75